MTHALRTAAGAAALAFLALHLSFLPASLEDLDSINFALGIRDFDVARHQPHPPGYPVYLAVAKLLRVVLESELVSLAVLSVLSGATAIVGMASVITVMDGRTTAAVAATLLAVSTPLFWVTASRPLSDMPGLAAALGVQVLVLSARTDRALWVAAALAGLAAGVRSQVVWLTLPVLMVALVRSSRSGWRRAATAAGAYVAGTLLWFVPLVLVSGGPGQYSQALASQGSEDFAGVLMLWTTPTPRQLVSGVAATFLTPWPFPATAAAVFLLAAAGLLVLFREHRAGLVTLTALFAPYLVFHLVFQETATTRYALPLVVPVAYLAVVGLWAIPGPRHGWLRVDGLRVASVVILAAPLLVGSQEALSGYASAEAPAFRMLADMTRARASDGPGQAPVLAMHRRAALDFRRPLEWIAPAGPSLEGRLPSPPKREWLEAIKYWNSGGRQPVWFVADPLRSDLALIDVSPPREYRWPSGLAPQVGGARPYEVDWYVIPPPAWYLGEGWALTPESAGVAREDGRGPGRQPIEGRIRRTNIEASLLIGGRKLSGAETAKVVIAIDDRPIKELAVSPGFFLEMVDVPAGALSGNGDYARLTIASDRDQVAIEQFDFEPVGGMLFGFGEGWHEAEYNQATGRRWRWTSERAVLRVRSGGQAALLSVKGETDPSASDPRVIVRAGGRVVVDEAIGRHFSFDVAMPAALFVPGDNQVTIETNETHVPADLTAGSQDRRRLGLLISGLTLRPAS